MKDEADHLKTLCYVKNACSEMCIPGSGYQMEQRLEPWRMYEAAQRSCKYDRYFNKKAIPSPETIKIISAEAPYSTNIFHSPLWVALKVTDPSPEEWIIFLSTLSPEIQSKIFPPRSSLTSPAIKTHIRYRTIKSIVRVGGLEALASLIALSRYKAVSSKYIRIENLNCDIHHLICVNMLDEPLQCIEKEFLEFIGSHANYLLPYPNDKNRSINLLKKQIRATKLVHTLLFKTKILSNKDSINECHYWLSTIDPQALMVDIHLLNSGMSLLPTLHDGLLAYIKKLNYKRHPSYKVGLNAFILNDDLNAPKLVEEIYFAYDDLLNSDSQ